MATVLKFPVKKELPKEVEDRLYEIAKIYVNLLDEVSNEICDDFDDPDEYAEMLELMLSALLNGVMKAIEELGESN